VVLSIEALQATSELEDVKDALRQAQNEIKEYQKKLMGFDKMRRDLGQKTKEVERLNSIVEKKEKKMASISRLAWGAQVVMQHMNKPDDERICHLSAEVERLCLELADKDQVIQDFKLKNAIDSLDSIAEHVGTELPSRTLRARTAVPHSIWACLSGTKCDHAVLILFTRLVSRQVGLRSACQMRSHVQHFCQQQR